MLPKKMNFKDTRQMISVPLAISTNLQQKKYTPEYKLSKRKTRKIIPGQMLSQDRPEKKAKRLFEAARYRVLDRHRSTKPTTAPWNLNGARSFGAPTHPQVMFTKRPVIRGERRPGVWYKHIWALLCRKQATKNFDFSPMAKKKVFFTMWEKSVGGRS